MPRPFVLSPTALRVLAITALSLSWLSACGKAEEAAQEAAAEAAIEAMSDAEVDVEDGGQTVSGVDEQGRAFSVSQGDAAKVPEDFPSGVLMPEGLVLGTSMVVGGSAMVGGTMPGELSELTARIDAHMKGAGWTPVMAMSEAGSSTLLWQRDDRSVSYMLETKPDGQIGVVVSHAVEPKETAVGNAP